MKTPVDKSKKDKGSCQSDKQVIHSDKSKRTSNQMEGCCGPPGFIEHTFRDLAKGSVEIPNRSYGANCGLLWEKFNTM